MTDLAGLTTTCSPTWCPGCGNLSLWAAFKNASVEKGWDNTNSVLVAGIGCHGHILNFIKLTSIETLHGRPIPVASGIKAVNPNLNVFVFTGDGDCLGEGGNHFIHACRRQENITVLIHNNGVYALTTGQTSPTSPEGFESKSTPEGNEYLPINPLALAITAGATFAAREYSGDIKSLTKTIIKASEHKGFSVIDILQPCVTFNKKFTHEFFRENCYRLDEKYNFKDKKEAYNKSLEFGVKKIPLGVMYEA